ncbi:hypothetical protein DPMN_045071 [Dreissena polymorpha]|uniref:Uncharacterized protein n=1 Tax=Dreissena polymorpha TaxID=45954 RepID=A0A9D4D459_DREPO|nr:hypothetical protein DPMN_045071 [Dreissena polymorpha]
MACLKSHIKRLFIEEYVSGWIAKQGGWKASISANIAPPVISIGGEIIKKVALVGLIAVGVVVVWKNRDKLREIWNIKPGLEETIIYS